MSAATVNHRPGGPPPPMPMPPGPPTEPPPTYGRAWRYIAGGNVTHALHGDIDQGVCGVAPAWFIEYGWFGSEGDEKAHADTLPRCRRCLTTIEKGI